MIASQLVAYGLALLALQGIPGPRTTYTSPVVNPAPGQLLCLAQNAGTVPVMVEAELFGADGSLADSGSDTVPPGRTVELAIWNGPGLGYCAFHFDADTDTLRGYIHRGPPGGDTRALFPDFSVRRGMDVDTVATTPPLRSLAAGVVFACLVQNVSDRSVEVETEVVDENGLVLDSTTDEVPPGTVASTIGSVDDHLGVYCRFTYSERADEIRGYGVLFDASGANPHLVFPATTSSSVGALTTLTPPVSSRPGDATSCVAQNLDDQALSIDAEIVDAAGTVIDDGNVLLLPGRVATIAGHTEGGANMVCRFTFDDEADRARAFITRYPSGLFRNTDLLELADAPGEGDATDLTTISPPVRIGNDGFLECAAVNLTEAAMPVHIEIVGGDGTPAAIGDANVPALRGQALASTINADDAVCTFGFTGNPSQLRGYATLTDDSGDRTQLLFAAVPPGPSPSATATPTATVTSTATRQPSSTNTATPTTTPTRTATGTLTPTPVPTDTPEPTASATADATATPTTPVGPACVGDCDGDGTVSIDELITLVTIGLGGPLANCPAGDRNADGQITIEELIAAVTNALNGCPA